MRVHIQAPTLLLIRASNFVFFDLFPIDVYSKQEKKIKSHIGIKK